MKVKYVSGHFRTDIQVVRPKNCDLKIIKADSKYELQEEEGEEESGIKRKTSDKEKKRYEK